MSDMEYLNKQEIGFLKEQITDLQNQVADVKKEMDKGFSSVTARLEILIDGYVKRDELEMYVSREEFKPVKAIVYGAAGLILTAVFSALVYLVVSK